MLILFITFVHFYIDLSFAYWFLSELFMFRTLIEHITSIFLSVCPLSFHCLYSVFSHTEVLNFYVVQLGFLLWVLCLTQECCSGLRIRKYSLRNSFYYFSSS